MRHHRLQRSTKHSIQERDAGSLGTLDLPHLGIIAICSPVQFETEGFLFDETIQESFDRFGMPPGLALIKSRDDVARGTRLPIPQDSHDFPLRVGDSWNFLHLLCSTIALAIGARLHL